MRRDAWVRVRARKRLAPPRLLKTSTCHFQRLPVPGMRSVALNAAVRCMLHVMKTWLNPKIDVRPSPIAGKGLFATVPIAQGEQLTRHGDDDYVIMADEEFQA